MVDSLIKATELVVFKSYANAVHVFSSVLALASITLTSYILVVSVALYITDRVSLLRVHHHYKDIAFILALHTIPVFIYYESTSTVRTTITGFSSISNLIITSLAVSVVHLEATKYIQTNIIDKLPTYTSCSRSVKSLSCKATSTHVKAVHIIATGLLYSILAVDTLLMILPAIPLSVVVVDAVILN